MKKQKFEKIKMSSLKNMRCLWEKLVKATSSSGPNSCLSHLQIEDEHFWAMWNDLSPCSSGYWSEVPKNQPEIPKIVSITDDEDYSDAISDICENRHCSYKPFRQSSESRQKCNSDTMNEGEIENSLSNIEEMKEHDSMASTCELAPLVYHAVVSEDARMQFLAVQSANAELQRLRAKERKRHRDLDSPTMICPKTQRPYGYV